MSLAEAVLEVAGAMDEEADECLLDAVRISQGKRLKSYAKQLRIVVKAAEGSEPPLRAGVPLLSPESQHRQMIDQCRKELHENKGLLKEDSLPQQKEPPVVST